MRGFDRAGYGPRDISTGDALGGSMYWATTAEIRFPNGRELSLGNPTTEAVAAAAKRAQGN